MSELEHKGFYKKNEQGIKEDMKDIFFENSMRTFSGYFTIGLSWML